MMAFIFALLGHRAPQSSGFVGSASNLTDNLAADITDSSAAVVTAYS